ncbi:Pentatricopeptide repeat-containing protein [Nymphaea thermarum]|nr:Pentatricopeptide repeat-containing protein [Nymphaea thermarum]
MSQQQQVVALLHKSIRSLQSLQQLHAYLLKSSLDSHQLPLSRLLLLLTSSSSLCYACSIYRHARTRNLFMANTIIRGHSQSDNPHVAVLVYTDLLKQGGQGNNFTFPPLIKACVRSDLAGKLGRQVHAHVVVSGAVNDSDVFVRSALVQMYSSNLDMATARKLFDGSSARDVVLWTAMIDGYARNNEIVAARQLFDEMPERTTVSWSAMIAGYVRVGMFMEALELFQRMQFVGTEPNESIVVSVLSACAHLGALAQGRWLHAYIARMGMEPNVFIGTALIDMYSKCGCIDQALLVFEGMLEKDVKSWNCIITALAMNGDARRALEFFSDMQKLGVRPNNVTFIAVLSSCAHAGLVEDGCHCFDLMVNVYQIDAKPEHYACMVDLLGRAGYVHEAEKFANASAQPDINIWGALLGACRIHGKVEIGDRIRKRMAQFGMNDCGSRVLLYNLYKSAGWLADASSVRKSIDDKGLTKVPGCSFIEVNGKIQEFLAGNSLHPCSTETLEMLEIMARTLIMEGG